MSGLKPIWELEKQDRLLQHKIIRVLIERWKRWISYTTCLAQPLNVWHIRMDTNNWWWVMEKVGSGEDRKRKAGERRECDLNRKMVLRINLLQLCMRQKNNITE